MQKEKQRESHDECKLLAGVFRKSLKTLADYFVSLLSYTTILKPGNS
jgi:hypothetical protein